MKGSVIMKHLSKTEGETPLQKHVRCWINRMAADYPDTGVKGVLEDLFHGGCQSGYVGHLVYYTDTVRFYKKHLDEIDALLKEMFEATGFYSPQRLFGDKWDEDDPLANTEMNQNLLAWFGFEATARNVAGLHGIEV